MDKNGLRSESKEYLPAEQLVEPDLLEQALSDYQALRSGQTDEQRYERQEKEERRNWNYRRAIQLGIHPMQLAIYLRGQKR